MSAVEVEVLDQLGLTPTPDDGSRLLGESALEEAGRPHRTFSAAASYPPGGPRASQHLIDIHDHLRRELETVRDLLDQVRSGALAIARARSVINELTMRQHNWSLGAYCASYCVLLTQHHTLEDRSVFTHLRQAEPGLGPVLDRLIAEHQVIHAVIEELDRRLIAHLETPEDFGPVQEVLDRLTDALLSHLSYEEWELAEPLARVGFYPGQL